MKNGSLRIDMQDYLEKLESSKTLALPLEFEYFPVEVISKQFTKLNSHHDYRIHYLGPRFTNTLVLHKKYSSFNKQHHYFQRMYDYEKYEINLKKIIQSNYINEKLQNNHYYKSAIFYRAFEGMNPTLNLKEEFIFNSCFEGGNLDCVIKIHPLEFDLFLRIDSNTRGHTQWFYFRVQNGQKKGKVTFNICNLTKPKTLYQQGMRPYVFSKRRFEKQKVQWQQSGENTSLTQRPLRYGIVYENCSNIRVYKLSFDYNFEEEDDEVYFAYCIPYTYSQMLGDISRLSAEFVKKDNIGCSLSGVDIPILHITNHQVETDKKNILITGRIHPGQSNSSYVLKGFIQFLCSNNKEAQQLRNRANFFIVPMVNPDGVIMGNSRASASGKDLNRQYLRNKRQLYPEVTLIKNFALRLQRQRGVFIFLDFHGHSRKKNTFLYGPSYVLSDSQYYKSKALARLIEKVDSSFRYYSCSFMISEEKKRTARAVFFQQLKIPYTFTIQSSIGMYYDVEKLKTIQFLADDWMNIGQSIGKGLSQYIVAYDQYEQILKERRLERKRKKQKLLMKKNTKKFSQDDIDARDESNLDGNTKRSMALFDLMEEIKQIPAKFMDQEASSDDHDDAQDLQLSKLSEFNHLIIQSKQKNQLYVKNKINEQEEVQSLTKNKRIESQNDELQIMKQIFEQKKQKKKTVKVIADNIAERGKNKINSYHSLRRTLPKSTCPVAKSTKLTLHHVEDGIGMPKSGTATKTQQFRHRKSFNFQTNRHLISKQFFPPDKCEIMEFPRSSNGGRKEVKKGRVLMDEYIIDKKKDKQQSRKPKSQQRVNRKPTAQSFSKLKMQQRRGARAKDWKNHDEKYTSTHTSNRIFDSVLFGGFHGMEVDNMAMMIKTFNR